MQPMPDIAALLKLAQSPAGQKLLTILQANHATDLDRIAAAAASGNLGDAHKQLSSLLENKESQDLLKQLEKQL